MSTAYEFLKANQVFHLATVDGTKARVRPFGFVMKRNDALYFCTNKTKDVYKQMVKCLMLKCPQWNRRQMAAPVRQSRF